jgi:hypothetical protein
VQTVEIRSECSLEGLYFLCTLERKERYLRKRRREKERNKKKRRMQEKRKGTKERCEERKKKRNIEI